MREELWGEDFEKSTPGTGSEDKNLDFLCAEVAAAFSIPIELIRSASRKRGLSPMRRVFIKTARDAGFSFVSIAQFLGRTPGAIANLMERGQ